MKKNKPNKNCCRSGRRENTTKKPLDKNARRQKPEKIPMHSTRRKKCRYFKSSWPFPSPRIDISNPLIYNVTWSMAECTVRNNTYCTFFIQLNYPSPLALTVATHPSAEKRLQAAWQTLPPSNRRLRGTWRSNWSPCEDAGWWTPR